MRRATPGLIDLGRRLLEHEAGGGKRPRDLAEAAERVFRKMHDGLIELIGLDGYRVLVARAIHLAKADWPLLRAVRAGQPELGLAERYRLDGLCESLEDQDERVAASALSALIGSFIWLLATLIGQGMALRLLRRIWPAGLFAEADSGSQEAGQ